MDKLLVQIVQMDWHVHLYKTTYKEYTQAGLEAFQSSDCVVSLFSGNFFGENCLLPPDDNLQFTAVAAEWSDLLILDLRDIVATLSEEEELVFVRLSAKLRYEKFLFLVKASLALRQIK
ncbi:hypothetical protein T484DRAFT_1780800 [Baffinella frigidus]|nr:hypothetical protein T484DRAFT_1780800 [Cryptophyta sp. CCMP2293]